MPKKSLVKDEIILKVIIDNNFTIFNDQNVLFKEKEEKSPWQAILNTILLQPELIDVPGDRDKLLTLHNLYMKFKKKDSCLLQAYKHKLKNGKNEAEKGLPEVQVSNECPKNMKKDEKVPASTSIIKTVEEQLPDINSETKNDIESLYALMSNMNFFNSIKHISPIPFQCIYWMSEQQFIWKKLGKCFMVLTTLSDIVHQVKFHSYSSSEDIYLFLLFIIVQDDRKKNIMTTPAAQALTEKVDVSFYAKFFWEYFKTADQPRTIVTGFSSILINGIIHILNKCSTAEYLNKCLDFLSCKNVELPFAVIIQADIITVLYYVDQLQSFQTIASSMIKNFFLRIIAYMSSIDDMTMLSETIELVLILMSCSCQNDLYKESLSNLQKEIKHNYYVDQIVENYLNHLKNELALRSLEVFKVADQSKYPQYKDEKNSLDIFIISLVSQAQRKVKSSIETNIPNPFEASKEFISDFLRLIEYFPIWTSVIYPNKESENLYIESVTDYVNKRPQTFVKKAGLHDFMKEHLTALNLDMDDAFKMLNDKVVDSNDYRNISNQPSSYLNFEEGWMGLNENLKKILDEEIIETNTLFSDALDIGNSNYSKQILEEETEETFVEQDPNYASTPNKNYHRDSNLKEKMLNDAFEKMHLKAYEKIASKPNRAFNKNRQIKKSRDPKFTVPCTDLDALHAQKTSGKTMKERFLRNTKSLGVYKRENKEWILENSSAFDCIFEIFSYAYRNLKTFQNYCNKVTGISTIENRGNFLNNVVNWCKSTNYQKTYAYRGLNIFNHGQKIESRIFLQQEIGELFLQIVDQDSFSIQQISNCVQCGISEEILTVIIQIEGSITKDKLENLQQELGDNQTLKYCDVCSMATSNIELNYGEYLFFSFQEQGNPKFFLHCIQKKIILKEQTFILVGVIGFDKLEDNRLYITYTRSIQDKWRKIEVLKRKVGAKNLDKIPETHIAAAIFIGI